MYQNGHAPDITTMPKSRAEQAAEKTRERYISGELDAMQAIFKLLDMIKQLGRAVPHLYQENKRLSARNQYLEAEIARAEKRRRHMTYTPRFLSQAEIDAFPRGQYVYLLQDVEVTMRYKIGKATSPRERFTEYTRWPFRWQVIAIIPTRNMHKLEDDLHERYSHRRHGGEWFELKPDDVLDIVTHTD